MDQDHENFYVDPLEQDAAMEEKRKKLEAEKAARLQSLSSSEEITPLLENNNAVRPDLNVSGFFSETAKKTRRVSLLRRPATTGTLTFGLVFGFIGVIYSIFYLVALITTDFDFFWFFGWLYAVMALLSTLIIFNSFRSLKLQSDKLKRKALIGLVGSAIALIPALAWLIHWLTLVIK